MLNFKHEYRTQMQQITPGAALLANTRELLLAPPRRHRGMSWLAAGAVCAAVVCALPIVQPDQNADQPAMLASTGGGMPPVYGDAAPADGYAEGTEGTENTGIVMSDRSAIQSDVTELAEADLAGLEGYAELLPAKPAGMEFSYACLADDGTLLVDYTDNGFDYLTLRVYPADTADTAEDNKLAGAYTVDELSADVLEACATASDQGARYLHITVAITVANGSTLLEYTAHCADMQTIWQAISAAKIFEN